MNILWFIKLLFGINFLGENSLAHISVLPIPKDFSGHGTQYRFQYFVRDESGDYKTQEEAGEGGRARGSYAVEEPNGEIRIVQYTADLINGFKAHIKVDHGKNSVTKMEEIDIPAEEMKKLIEKNDKNIDNNYEKNINVKKIDDELSKKSYVIGPPKKMSQIVMEQAAAIREIISKEIEAEKKREITEEKLRNKEIYEKQDKNNKTIDTTTTESYKMNKKCKKNESEDFELRKTDTVKLKPADEKEENSKISETKEIQISSTPISDLDKLNEELELDIKTSNVRKIEEKKNTQSAVVNDVKIINSKKVNDNNNHHNNNQKKNREEIYEEKEQSKISSERPVRNNFGIKNRIMFYKPAANDELISSSDNDSEIKFHPDIKKNEPKDLIDKINKNNGEKGEEIVLYSPNENGNEGNGRNRFIKVPYEVLRPYFEEIKEVERK